MVKKLLFGSVFLVNFLVFSQSNFNSGWLPKVNISTKINDKIKWVNSVEARESFYSKENFEFKHKLIDLTSVFSLKTNANQSFNFGYIVRFSDKNTVHRLLQHYNFIASLDGFKLANRLGFEQFFSKNNTPQYRTRYRATIQKALSGQRVDVKEFYLKISNEYLYQFNKEDLEVRLAPYLGYQLSKNDKLEFGLDYRLGNVFESQNKNNLWFRTTWYVSF